MFKLLARSVIVIYFKIAVEIFDHHVMFINWRLILQCALRIKTCFKNNFVPKFVALNSQKLSTLLET